MNRALYAQTYVEGIRVDAERVEEAKEENFGWCPSCEDFTTPNVKPSDRARPCLSCFDDRVSGTQHAIKAGFIIVELSEAVTS
jgi:hypothetical protein